MTKALDGLLVVDLTVEFWGSLAAALLGDFGADVVRIDALGAPVAVPDDEPTPAWNACAELANRNKASLAVDVMSEAGRAIVAFQDGKQNRVTPLWERAPWRPDESCGQACGPGRIGHFRCRNGSRIRLHSRWARWPH